MSGVLKPLINLMRWETRMYGSTVLKLTTRNQTRTLATSHRNMDKAPGTEDQHSANLGDFHHPTNYEKKVLVWTKMYPSVEAVPETVSLNKLRKARDMFRIRINLGMIFLTVLGCCIVIYTGRKARNEGDSISKRGIAWQKEMQEKGRQERAAAAEASSKS